MFFVIVMYITVLQQTGQMEVKTINMTINICPVSSESLNQILLWYVPKMITMITCHAEQLFCYIC